MTVHHLALAAAMLAAPPSIASEQVLYAPVAVRPAAPPKRFEAPLPRVKDFPDGMARLFGWPEDARFPPRAYARDLLCAGDERMWKRARTALQASVRDGATWADVFDTYGYLVQHCAGDRCWAIALAERGPLPAMLPAWLAAARCDAPAARALFERADVPAAAMLARAWSARYEGVSARPPTARVGAAGLEVIRSGPIQERRAAAFDAAASGDPAAIDALAEMARATPDARWRGDLYAALAASEHPRARAAVEPCLRTKEAAWACGLPWVEDVQEPPRYADDDFASRLRHGNVDDVIDHAPPEKRPALVAALDACAREAGNGDLHARWARVRCLRGLARVDREKAVAAAPTLAALDDPDARELVAALTRYPAPGALQRRLRELRLLPQGAPRAKKGPEGFSARELLVSGGAAAEVDVETSQFPNEHDTLMRELWGLGRERLAGILFEEVAPADEEGPYALRAYADGLRFETAAQNLGDWYDVGAVVGLLNAIERHRGRDRRFVVLATEDQTTAIASGPEAGLGRAIAEGLLVTGNGLASVQMGKAAEEVVREKLERDVK